MPLPPPNLANWLPGQIGPVEIQDDGTPFTPRTKWNIKGAALSDDEDNDTTIIDLTLSTGLPSSSAGEYLQNIGGTNQFAPLDVDLASDASGVLPVANGGTGTNAVGVSISVLSGSEANAGRLWVFTGSPGAPSTITAPAPGTLATSKVVAVRNESDATVTLQKGMTGSTVTIGSLKSAMISVEPGGVFRLTADVAY